MEEKGYWVYKECIESNSLANDLIFVKEDFLSNKKFRKKDIGDEYSGCKIR